MPATPLPRLERSDGTLLLHVARDPDGATRVADLYQRDPCRALFPLGEADDVFQAVMVTTSGGLAGGDRIAVEIAAGPGAAALVTTQAAEKIYRARDEATTFSARISAADGAWLEWLPQETILFDGARFRRETRIELSETARLLAAEIVVFGRTARGERIEAGEYVDRWHVSRGGKLVWADALSLTEAPAAALAHPAGFGGAVAAATAIYAGPDAADQLQRAREAVADEAADVPRRIGVTLVNGLLLARFLSNDAQELRSDLARLWCSLRKAAGNLPAKLPRTWYT
ncbi:MAG: urease accessory protein UreD [Rhodospirillaceae bacterium]|nr:urease accessory protein UreD [Rhodospirillaceae bacterium]